MEPNKDQIDAENEEMMVARLANKNDIIENQRKQIKELQKEIENLRKNE